MNLSMKQKEITLDELFNRGLLPIKAINICRNAGLNTMSQILEFYERNGSFLGLEESNKLLALHLIKFSKTYRDLPIDFYENSNINKKSQNKITDKYKIVERFEQIKVNVLDRQIEFLISKLKARIRNYLLSLFRENSTAEFLNYLYSDKFNISEITLGNDKLAEAINDFKVEVYNLILKLDKLSNKELDSTIPEREIVTIFEKVRKVRTPKPKTLKNIKTRKNKAKRKVGRPQKEAPVESVKGKASKSKRIEEENKVSFKKGVGRHVKKLYKDADSKLRNSNKLLSSNGETTSQVKRKAGRPKSEKPDDSTIVKRKVGRPKSKKENPSKDFKRKVGRPKIDKVIESPKVKRKVGRPSKKITSIEDEKSMSPDNIQSKIQTETIFSKKSGQKNSKNTTQKKRVGRPPKI